MEKKLIKLIKSYPPVFEFEIDRDGVPTIIKAKALFWNYYDEDARQDKLKTSIERFAFEKNLDCWLYGFEYQQLDEWPIQAIPIAIDPRIAICNRAIELWNANSLSWSRIATQLGEIPGDAFEKEVRKYASRNNIPLREGKTGRRKNRE